MTAKEMRKYIGTIFLASSLFMAAGCGTSGSGTAPDSDALTSSASTAEGSPGRESGTSDADDNSGVVAEAVTSDMINFKDSDEYTDYTSSATAAITCDGDSVGISGSGVSVSGTDITISSEGTYVFKGSLPSGSITVNAGEDDKVILVLNGFAITNTEGPAIDCESADKVTISTVSGTENTVTDSSTRADEEAEELDAAVYSTCDLVLNGDGTLEVHGNFKDAAHSKDDLRITSGTYIIHSVDDGLVGKDRLEIKGGDFNVMCEEDAFSTTNEEDEEKGFIYIADGTFQITSGDEGFQAARNLMVTGGTFTIAAQGKGFHADNQLQITDGTISVTSSYEGLEAPIIVLDGGTIDIAASDDGINAAGGGTGSDADSSDDSPDPWGDHDTGEGHKRPDMSGNRMPSDDAGTSRNGPGEMGGGMMSDSTGYLYINGGEITIDASGDGIDSNTSITQTGGTVTVNGPTSSGDGALDYDDSYIMTGGTLLAAGSSGMLQSISEDGSDVNCLTVIYDSTQKADTVIKVKDSDGNELFSFAPSKEYQSFTYADASLKDGETYTVWSDDTQLSEVTLSGTVTTVSDSGEAAEAGFGGMGGPGGN